MEISLISLGSSQTLPLPHLSTHAASRLCTFSDTIFAAADQLSRLWSRCAVWWRKGEVRNAAVALYIDKHVRVSLAGSGLKNPPLKTAR
jgi:hypothetical protein